MFLTADRIRESLEILESVHPFYGITFLVLKKGNLPIGRTTEFSINAETKRFLEQYYKPDRNSEYYCRIFRISDKKKGWLASDYPNSGLQSINTREFGDVFIHPKGSKIWGWKPDYVETLKFHLYRRESIPAFHLAVWLYHERVWPSDTTPEDIVKTFLEEFSITEDEERALFDVSTPEKLLLQGEKISRKKLQTITGKPPDAPPEEGGTLAYLGLKGVGSARQLEFEPGERLTLITGDNGLGKTFLLECAWWALSGQWAGLPAYPRQDAKVGEPKITFQISGEFTRAERISISYDWQTQRWRSPKKRPTIPGLLIYARVDGSFAVWDPAKDHWATRSDWKDNNLIPRSFVFTKDQVWDGLEAEIRGEKQVYCNGLLRDWITWQNNPKRYPFRTLKGVLHRLSPPDLDKGDLGPLEPGSPTRLPYDAREIPTLKHPYGEVPIVHTSAGVRRIVAMAYLIVWTWEEHKTHSQLLRREPERRMVILVDEMEAHLHPQWQRVILPALLDVREELDSDLQVQLLIATHSPLVTVSVESRFDVKIDKLFHLDLARSDLFESQGVLEEKPFVRYGRVDHWLMSDVFELLHARSREAEDAIEAAKALQLQDKPKMEAVQSVSGRLVKYLSENDEFWPRWKYFAEQHGVRF